MNDQVYTEKDIAAKALIILEEQLRTANGSLAEYATEAWSQAEQELIAENQANWRDLDTIQEEIDAARRRGSLPAQLVDRLMEAARHYKEQLDLTRINEEHYESRLKTRAKSKV